MFVPHYTKNALGLTGVTDPTQQQLEDAVATTGYSGYVSLEFEAQKTPPAPLPEPGDDGGEALLAEPKAAAKSRSRKAK